MKHAHTYMLAVVVACLLAFVSCRAVCEYLGIAVGAGGAAVVSGGNPIATAGGGIAGKEGGSKLADALGADKEYTADEYRQFLEDAAKQLNDAHKTIAALQAREPVRVPVEVPVDRPFIPAWVWYSVGLFLAFRFRHGLAALFASLTTGGVKAALLTLAGIVWGGPVADKAKAAVAEHEEQNPRALAIRRLRRADPPRQEGTPS